MQLGLTVSLHLTSLHVQPNMIKRILFEIDYWVRYLLCEYLSASMDANIPHLLWIHKIPTFEELFYYFYISRQRACLSASIKANMRGNPGPISSNYQWIWIHNSKSCLRWVIRDGEHVWVRHRFCVTFQVLFHSNINFIGYRSPQQIT